ncbi:MAG TPA: flagellar biosynthesis protein FlgJ [Lacunisphaera sp.]
MAVSAISHATSAAATLAAAGKPQSLRNLPQAEQVKAAAGQFEAIILRQLLQDSVGKIAGEGASGNVYGFMLTDVIANKLSEGGGLGLSGMLEKQLTPRAPKTPTPLP